MKPFVSIITPAYNHEKFIRACIKSTLAQTFKNWEQIIIDDGSTDRTGEIVKSYQDPRIRYLYQPHQGIWKIGATYNKALSLAQGKYIAVLEGDDYWFPYKLEKQLPLMEDEHVILSFGECVIVNEKGKELNRLSLPEDLSIRNNMPVGKALEWYLRPIGFVVNQTVLVRKSTLEKIGGFIQPEYLPTVDYGTYLRLCLEGPFRGLPVPLAVWRRHISSGSLETWLSNEQEVIRHCFKFIQNYRETIKEIAPSLDLRGMVKEWQRLQEKLARNYFYREGRLYLTLGKYTDARRDFHKALVSPTDCLRRISSVFGLFCAILRIDLIQPLYRLIRG